jgi:hypothetical protein
LRIEKAAKMIEKWEKRKGIIFGCSLYYKNSILGRLIGVIKGEGRLPKKPARVAIP